MSNNIFDKIYEDLNGIQYKVVGFENNQYKLKVIDSPFDTIKEGIVEKRHELPERELSPSTNTLT